MNLEFTGEQSVKIRKTVSHHFVILTCSLKNTKEPNAWLQAGFQPCSIATEKLWMC